MVRELGHQLEDQLHLVTIQAIVVLYHLCEALVDLGIALEDKDGQCDQLADLIGYLQIVVVFLLFVVLARAASIKLDYLPDDLLLDGLGQHGVALLKVEWRLRPIGLRSPGGKEHVHLDSFDGHANYITTQRGQKYFQALERLCRVFLI